MDGALAAGLSIHGLNSLVFLDKTLYSHVAFSTNEYKLMAMCKMILWGNLTECWHVDCTGGFTC